MKKINYSAILIISALIILSYPVKANDPTSIPWPVGTDQGKTKTLLNSYGEPNTWDERRFHAGIDIDALTETGDDGDEVRCVINGVVSEIRDFYIGGVNQWVVITTAGTDTLNHEDYGWWYEHLSNPTEPPYNLEKWESVVNVGTNLGHMHPDVSTPHIHFKWSWWEWPIETDDLWDWCYVNPLDYLTPEATGSDYWIFNPNENAHEFRAFFYEQMIPSAWPGLAGSVLPDTLNRFALGTGLVPDGDIDLMFGFSLKGEGESTTPDCGRDDLAPERIGWNIIRETTSGNVIIEENFNVNFNCPLSNEGDDDRVRQLYFRHQLHAVFPEDEGDGLIVCLTNCGDMQGWTNLGIDNIEENSWDTNADYQFSDDTVNPVLAAYKDGPYKIKVTCYSHGDPAVEWNQSIDCELHNFHPAVEEVIISGSSGEIYHAQWTPGETYLDPPELVVSVDMPVGNSEILDAEIIFTEPMNTSSLPIVTAGLDAPYDQIAANETGWSSTNCPDDPAYRDTWHGTLDGMAFLEGEMTLSIQAEDTDANVLMDPETTSEDPYIDIHHGFTLEQSGDNWVANAHSYFYGSPVLSDLDVDGDLDIIAQSEDGWVHVFDDDGNNWNANWPRESGDAWGIAQVYSTPVVVNIDDNGTDEILAVKEDGCNAWDANTAASPYSWPVVLGTEAHGHYPSHTSPVIEDVDNDGFPEIIVCRCLVDGNPSQHTVFLYEHTGGEETWSVNLNFPGGESVASTPAVGDISSAHNGKEILVCTAGNFGYPYPLSELGDMDSGVYLLDPDDGDELWSTYVYGRMFSSPTVADVDNDGVMEIAVGVSGTAAIKKVILLNGNTGAIEHTWDTGGWVQGPAAISDLNNDGYLDIAVAANGGSIDCWSGSDYTSLPGFPVTVDGNPSKGISIADIDGDMELELVYVQVMDICMH